ncbi:MAG: PEP-CTERM system histidine kinase PrsK [Gammaproteobacteria bacterium]|nr:PEP-CTERM system histidine kinase PrsK [Gammaproteobacteria bacterium]
MTIDPALFGYSIAAIAYSALMLGLLTVWRSRFRGPFLVLATAATAFWAALIAYSRYDVDVSQTTILFAEIIRDGAWLLFLSSLLYGAIMDDVPWFGRYGGVSIAVGVLALGVGVELLPFLRNAGYQGGSVLVLGSIVTSLYGLIALEQIHRNARNTQRRTTMYLCLGIAALLAIDLFLYSNAIFDGEISLLFWDSRGFVVAMSAFLIGVATSRRQAQAPGIFVSRQVVFYSATLIGAGIYLTLVGLAGYFVQRFDQHWGAAAQVILFVAAVILFMIIIMSEQTRARFRVFIAKHFFENKYDYRDEWLRLIHTLTDSEEDLPLRKRAIKALAQIVGSPSGMLWLQRDGKSAYEPYSSWDVQLCDHSWSVDGPLIAFLRRTGWVLNLDDLQPDSEAGAEVQAEKMPAELSDLRIVVPLMHEDRLLGLVGLSKPKTPVSLNFEDHDLLKTAGKQIASYLAQEIATEQLAESRQFEAFNRLTAYVMHDLKNAIAQQSLVVENAERHKRNPAFIDDAIETIKGSVVRMRRVVEQLKQGAREEHADKVDVGSVILGAIAESQDRKPVPTAILCDERILVRADQERLRMALYHAIRNAQDATPDDGSIEVELTADGGRCIIRISDTGCGMDAAFIRDRLFRPFDSTKGTQGMGIGAYQIRETLRAARGDLDVESLPEKGTSLFFRLPLGA